MSHIHVPHKTPRDSSIMTITPNTNNNFANAFELPPVKNVATMPQDTLLPLLGAEPPDLFPHGKSTTPTQPTLTQRSCSDECGSVVAQDSYRATPHSPKVIDLTNESTKSSTEPPKKRNKTTTIEVTVIVTMPGLAQPSVKKCSQWWNQPIPMMTVQSSSLCLDVICLYFCVYLMFYVFRNQN